MANLWERISGALGWTPPEDEYEDEYGSLEELAEDLDSTSWESFNPSELSSDEIPELSFERERVVNVAGMGGPRSIRVAVAEPKGFESVQGVANQLKRQIAVVVNVEKLDRAVARRVIDFLSGTVYALDGEMQQVSNGVVIFVPQQMRIDVLKSEETADGRSPIVSDEELDF